jgi:hypothetical protein
MGFRVFTWGVAAAAISADAILPLLAQAVAPGISDFPFGSITASGVVCWYAYYTTAKTIPGIVSTHHEANDREREMFAKMIAEEREHHARQIDKLDARLKVVEDLVTKMTHDFVNAVHELAASNRRKEPAS